MTYSLRMVKTGEIPVPWPEVYWMERFQDWTHLQFQMGVIRGGGKTILINTGFPEEIGPLASAWAAFLGEKAVLRRPDDWKTKASLQRLGIETAEVDYVLLTPIQIYTTGNLRLFPNAKFCFSRRGWMEDLLAPAYPHHVPREGCISDEDLFWLLGPNRGNLVLLDDDDEPLPGLRTKWIGVHHRSSFLVEVDTPKGTAIVSDCAFHFRNLEERIPLGIAESIIEAHAAYDYIARTADIFVPLYDPEVQSRFPGGAVA